MPRWVLLKHVVKEGESHLDWMIERPAAAAGGGTLRRGRLAAGTDVLGGAGFAAELIGDHRREYLEYEGPVSGGRGEVRRVAGGECELEVRQGWVRVEMGGRVLVGREEARGGWRFELASSG